MAHTMNSRSSNLQLLVQSRTEAVLIIETHNHGMNMIKNNLERRITVAGSKLSLRQDCHCRTFSALLISTKTDSNSCSVFVHTVMLGMKRSQASWMEANLNEAGTSEPQSCHICSHASNSSKAVGIGLWYLLFSNESIWRPMLWTSSRGFFLSIVAKWANAIVVKFK